MHGYFSNQPRTFICTGTVLLYPYYSVQLSDTPARWLMHDDAHSLSVKVFSNKLRGMKMANIKYVKNMYEFLYCDIYTSK